MLRVLGRTMIVRPSAAPDRVRCRPHVLLLSPVPRSRPAFRDHRSVAVREQGGPRVRLRGLAVARTVAGPLDDAHVPACLVTGWGFGCGVASCWAWRRPRCCDLCGTAC